MDGRWTLHVCKDCGQRAHYQERCPRDRRRVWTEQVEVPVVPCDDAAVERGAERIDDLLVQLGVDPSYAADHAPLGTVKRILAEAVLRAAGETS